MVRDRLHMLTTNGMQGLVAVFLVLWLFFSFRYSFWVTMGLPVSFLGALFVLPMLGITINMVDGRPADRCRPADGRCRS